MHHVCLQECVQSMCAVACGPRQASKKKIEQLNQLKQPVWEYMVTLVLDQLSDEERSNKFRHVKSLDW